LGKMVMVSAKAIQNLPLFVFLQALAAGLGHF
jgi:hypothetical protein